jgi:hypothetical protein
VIYIPILCVNITSMVMVVIFEGCTMSLFDRYFLILAGRVPESEAGVVASIAFQTGVLTLGWPLDTRAENAANTHATGCGASNSLIRSDRSAL